MNSQSQIRRDKQSCQNTHPSRKEERHSSEVQIMHEISQNKTQICCNCCCHCGKQSQTKTSEERKRQRRKQYKRRQKEKQKQLKEKSLKQLQQIIKDIYELELNFSQCQPTIQNCINAETNRDKFYDFINLVIREEVDRLRKIMANCLLTLAKLDHKGKKQCVQQFFSQVEKIKEASPEIEKIINLFVNIHFDSQIEQQPLQRNLDQMTLKFLVKNDLVKQENFTEICRIVFEQEQFQHERQLLHFMMNAYYNSETKLYEEDCDYSGYESEQWEEGSNGDSMKQEESRNRKRREKKKKIKKQISVDEEAIVNRLATLEISEEYRVNCNVTEEWLDKIRKKREAYQYHFN